jgi:hypothetical protein
MLGKKHFNDKEKKALAEKKKIGGLRGGWWYPLLQGLFSTLCLSYKDFLMKHNDRI